MCKQAGFHARLRPGVHLDPAGEDCGSWNDSRMHSKTQVSVLGRTEHFLAFFPHELHAILCHVVLPAMYFLDMLLGLYLININQRS